MNVRVAIIDGPLVRAPLSDAADCATGAVLRFEGVVRRDESGRELRALEYRTYDPMAERELLALARDVGARHGLRSLTALHSRGVVGVGEVSFVLEVTGAHRAETLGATAEFIDRLKRDVPIWKVPLWV